MLDSLRPPSSSSKEFSSDERPSNTCRGHVARTFVTVSELHRLNLDWPPAAKPPPSDACAVSACAQAGVLTGVGGHNSLGEAGGVDEDAATPRLERSRENSASLSNADISGIGLRCRLPLSVVAVELCDSRLVLVKTSRLSLPSLRSELLRSPSSSGIPGIGEQGAASK